LKKMNSPMATAIQKAVAQTKKPFWGFQLAVASDLVLHRRFTSSVPRVAHTKPQNAATPSAHTVMNMKNN
jgi:hypothetical protein